MKPGDNCQSARIVGLEYGLTSLSDHAGGNAATSRVEELHGQCDKKGFVDIGVPFAQRMAEAEMLAPNGSPKEENSRQSRLFFAALTVLLDWTPEGKSILRVSGAFARNYLNGFWVHMAGQPGVYAHFSFLGSIRGEMLFSVDEWRPETDQQLCPPSPLLRLRGPFQKGPSDDL